MSRTQWFSEAKFGMFIHWWLYALTGRDEWVMHRDGISPEEYAALTAEWNPDGNPAEAWCRTAKESGMKYAVFTALHHDGFSLFNTKTDSFSNINTPAARDYVADFTAACRKYDLKVGIYYLLLDRRLTDTPERMKAIAWEQIRELMTDYGQIDILWYDGSCLPKNMEIAVFWDSHKLNAMVRRARRNTTAHLSGSPAQKAPHIRTPLNSAVRLVPRHPPAPE